MATGIFGQSWTLTSAVTAGSTQLFLASDSNRRLLPAVYGLYDAGTGNRESIRISTYTNTSATITRGYDLTTATTFGSGSLLYAVQPLPTGTALLVATSAGAYTFTAASSLTRIQLQAAGGDGGGNTGSNRMCSGGSSGAYFDGWLHTIPGSVYAAELNAPGTASYIRIPGSPTPLIEVPCGNTGVDFFNTTVWSTVPRSTPNTAAPAFVDGTGILLTAAAGVGDAVFSYAYITTNPSAGTVESALQTVLGMRGGPYLATVPTTSAPSFYPGAAGNPLPAGSPFYGVPGEGRLTEGDGLPAVGVGAGGGGASIPDNTDHTGGAGGAPGIIVSAWNQG